MKNFFIYNILTLLLLFLAFVHSGHTTSLENRDNKITVQLYSPQHPSYFVLVNKSEQSLSLYQHGQTLKLIKKYTCATGETPGTKQQEGDSRTPEGVYFITEQYEDSKITVFGSRAFHLDYPNVFDKHAGHQGDGIFIHGTNKKLIPYSTNGCITLDNNDLEELAPHLAVDSVPVVVVNTMDQSLFSPLVTIEKSDFLFNNILNLLAINSPDFYADNAVSLSFFQINNQAIASIRYNVFDSSLVQYRYTKRVYLASTSSDEFRTLYGVHSQQTIPMLVAIHPVKNDIPPIVEPIRTPTNLDRGNDLLQFIEKWRIAWSSKDIESYIDCYSPTFRSGQFNRSGWKRKKARLNKRYTFIDVQIENIVVEWTNLGANVTFFQDYRSDQYHTSGNKLLRLVHNDQRWRIQEENM